MKKWSGFLKQHRRRSIDLEKFVFLEGIRNGGKYEISPPCHHQEPYTFVWRWNRSIIDHIEVSFDGVNKTHQLDVNFRVPMLFGNQGLGSKPKTQRGHYSTVTLLARFLGWSTLHPRMTAM